MTEFEQLLVDEAWNIFINNCNELQGSNTAGQQQDEQHG